jgi:hypothetical protein
MLATVLRSGAGPAIMVFGILMFLAQSVSEAQACDNRWSDAFPGDGFNESAAYAGSVNALALHDGELHLAGDFAGCMNRETSYVARWNGSVWQPLGSGMGGSDPSVCTLAVFDGELVAGGNFEAGGEYVSCFWGRWACERCVGDLNCDGFIDFADINPFVAHLSNFNAWQAEFAGRPPENGDINGDGTFGQASFGDINPFVTLMMHCGTGCGCPGPGGAAAMRDER